MATEKEGSAPLDPTLPADPIQFSSSFVLEDVEATNTCPVPFGFTFSTFARLTPAPPLLMHKMIICSQCGAVLNPFCPQTNSSWSCVFCQEDNVCAFGEIEETERVKRFPETAHTTVDYAESAGAANFATTSLPALILVLDVTSDIKELRCLRNAIEVAFEGLSKQTMIGLVLFESLVRVYELGMSSGVVSCDMFGGQDGIAEAEIGAMAEHESTQDSPYLAPLFVAKERVLNALDAWIETRAAEGSRTSTFKTKRCTFAALHYGLALARMATDMVLANQSCRVLLSVSGPTTVGIGKTPPPSAFQPDPSVSLESVAGLDDMCLMALEHGIVIDALVCSPVEAGVGCLSRVSIPSGGVLCTFQTPGEAFASTLRNLWSSGRVGNWPCSILTSTGLAVDQVIGCPSLPTEDGSIGALLASSGEELACSQKEWLAAGEEEAEEEADKTLVQLASLTVSDAILGEHPLLPKYYKCSLFDARPGLGLAVYLRLRDPVPPECVHLQVVQRLPSSDVPSGSILRVATRRVRVTEKESEFFASVAEDAVAALIAKSAVATALQESSDPCLEFNGGTVTELLNSPIVQLAQHFTAAIEPTATVVPTFPRSLMQLPLRLFHTLRGPLGTGPLLSREGRYALRLQCLSAGQAGCLTMQCPEMWTMPAVAVGEPMVMMPAPLDTLSLYSDCIAILDVFSSVYIWVGARVPPADAERIAGDCSAEMAKKSGSRVPTPDVLVVKEKSSLARFVLCRASPAHRDPPEQQEVVHGRLGTLSEKERAAHVGKFLMTSQASFMQHYSSLFN